MADALATHIRRERPDLWLTISGWLWTLYLLALGAWLVAFR
jgi:hypothetical protein